MTQARVIVTERGGVDLADEWVESDPVVDELLVKGIVTTSTVLTFEDSTNGAVTLSDTLQDELSKVSANDTLAGFLNGKLVAGAGITLTELGDGGNETLSIAALGVGTDELAKVTSNDTTAGYLFDKVIGTTNKITVTEVNDAGDEDLQINVGTDIFDKVVDDTDDITEGTTNLFFTDERVDDRVAALIIGGTNLTATYDDGANTLTLDVDAAADTKEVQVSANDTTPGFLLAKLVAGANITLTELGDGGNETLSIAAATPVDERARVSANDSVTGFLIDKITGGDGINVTEINDGGDEDLDIDLDISTLTNDAGPLAGTDEFALDDGTNNLKVTLSVLGSSISNFLNEAVIDHDALLNFVANEHVDHTGVSVVAGGDDALSVTNNDLSSNIGLTVDIIGTTAEATADDADSILIHDDTVGALRSMTRANFLSGIVTADELVGVSANDTTPGYLLDKLTSTGSSITLTEVNDAGDEDLNLEVNEANVDHDSLQNFVANEHVDHSAVSVLLDTTSGLAVVTDNLTADIDLELDISTLNAQTTLSGTDEFAFDDGTTANQKITFTNLVTAVEGIIDLGIDDLNDVDTTTTAPIDGDVLTWNNANSEWEPQMGGGVFGSEYVAAQNTATASTTSTTPVQRLTINPTGMTAGFVYRVSWSYQWRYTNTSNDFMARIDQDNGTILATHDWEAKDSSSTQRGMASGFITVTGLTGSHTFDLDWWSEVGSQSAFIYNASLAFWRVS